MDFVLNIIISFRFILPNSGIFFLAPILMLIVLFLLYCLSLSRSALSDLDITEAKILHKKKNKQQQRLYTFYQRKDKIKASISTFEIFLCFLFVFLSFSLIKSDYNIFSDIFSVFDFYGDATFQYVVMFVSVAFALVLTIEIPSRIYSERTKEKFLAKTSFFTNAVYKLFSGITFVQAYAKKKPEEDGGEISQALSSSKTEIGGKEILKNILQFGDTQVREIMTPRHDIVSVSRGEKFLTVKKTIQESNFSRIPVYESTPDEIFGIIYVKDLLKFINKGDDFDWTRLVRKITFVSENKKISDLLKVFRQRKIHMAAVSDEYGGISGLITMQDILEEIVGEINDEFDDIPQIMFKKIDENHYIFDGKILLGDFCKALSLEEGFFDDVKGDAESLAGVLLEIKGEFPDKGENIVYRNLNFTIEAFNNRRIEKISVKI